MASPNDPPPFGYSLFPSALQALRDYGQVARQRGLAFEFARDLEALTDRLRADPVGLGDPLYDFHHLGMTYFRGRSEFLFAYYCVNISARQVIVQRFLLNPYSRLA